MVSFTRLYDRVIELAAHKSAPAWLGALSLSEAIFLPIPPDTMLIPMVLAQRAKAWLFATITTVSSVAGGVVGYFIGVYLLDALGWPVIQFYGLGEEFNTLQSWYDDHGALVVLISGFTPIPYKLFTIASGAFSMDFMLYVLMSTMGRGLRFFMVSALCRWAGDSVHHFIRRYATPVGWTISIVLVVAIIYWTL